MINRKANKQGLKMGSKMQRTQIMLDPIQHKQLADLASQEGVSMSEVVRQMLDEFIRTQKRRALERQWIQ